MGTTDATATVSLRQVFRSSGIYSVATVSKRATALLLLPVYTYYLTPSDYGVLELLELAGSMTSLLVGLQLGQAIFYYYHHAATERDRQSYLSTGMIAALMLGVVATVTGLLLAAPISTLLYGTARYARFVRIFFLGFAGSFPTSFGYCYLRVYDRPTTLVTVSLAGTALMAVLNVVFLAVAHWGVAAMLWSRMIVFSLTALYFLFALFSQIPLRFGRKHFLELVRYSLPLAIGGLGNFVLHFGDRIFLRANVTLSALGIYSLAYKLGMLVFVSTTPFFSYWESQMMGIVTKPRGEQLYVRVTTYFLLGITGVGMAVALFAHPVIDLMTTSSFHGAARYVPWLAAAYVIRSMGAYCSNSFLLVKRSGWVARVTLLAAGVCLAGYAVLIPWLKVWGAVLATLLGFGVLFTVALWKGQQIRPFAFEYRRWGKIMLSAVTVVAVFYLAEPAGFWFQLFLGVLFLLLFLGLLFALRFFYPSEKETMRELLAATRLAAARLFTRQQG